MRRTLRALLVVLTGAAFVGLVALSASRFLDILRPLPLAITAFSAYALPGYAVLLVVLLLLARRADKRRIPLAAALVSLVLLLCHVYWVSAYVPADGPDTGDLRVMSANLEVGQGDPEDVVRAAAGVDVVVLQEVTPDALSALKGAGLDRVLTHSAGTAVGGVRGTMVFSRYRLQHEEPVDLGNGGLVVDVAASEPFRLYAVHTAMLLSNPQRWHDDLALMRTRLAADTKRGPVLAVGDWNATYSHLQMRRVLDSGMRDAAQEAGTWHPTWPTHWRKPWLRPLVAIDHVLMSDGFGAAGTSVVPIAHTDHMAVIATLAPGFSPRSAARQ